MGKMEQKLCFGLFNAIDMISESVGKTIIPLELEYCLSVDGYVKKVDILAKDEEERNVFIEVQLTASDIKHAESINTLIEHDSANDSDFYWIASGFDEEIVCVVKQQIVKLGKCINLVCLEMDLSWVNLFKQCEIRDFHVLDDIYTVANFNDLSLRKVMNFSNTVIGNVREETVEHQTRYEHHQHKLVKKILESMRCKSQYMPLHFYKNFMKSRISTGVGADSVTAILGTSPHRRTVFYTIQFYNNNELFQKTVGNYEEIQKKLNNLLMISYDNSSLSIELPNTEFTEKNLTEFFATSALLLLEYVHNEITS